MPDLGSKSKYKGELFMARRGGFPGGGMGGGNMNNIMKQAMKMQKDMEKAQEELADKTVEAASGGGAVSNCYMGKEIRQIEISKDVVILTMLKCYRTLF